MNTQENKIPVIFVAFLEQDNLGVGHIASILLSHNIKIKIVDFRLGEEEILNQIVLHKPEIIGFSIIFQYHINNFKTLLRHLRGNGIKCHFNAGGHFPSLKYSELLDIIPDLDSITLFEGEHTFLELTQFLLGNKNWKNIEGLAYRESNLVKANPLRTLEKDLDNFPPPVRQPLREYALGKKYATILAGRGCYYNCSFCSIREFYSKPPGAVKRIRKPEMVVREMELLYQQLDCSVFMFQDDDFPVASHKGKEWVNEFSELLVKKDLARNILWKINCRPDEIDKNLFEKMKQVGLFLVYLGIENGTDEGLELMNKHITKKTNIQSVKILNKLKIKYDFGFMLFHPESTFKSVAENLDFLISLCGDGSSPVTFCKMLPYAATKIETKLKEEGRLKGSTGFEDYDFYSPNLNRYYSFVIECFEEWISSHSGVLNIARWARYYLLVRQKYYNHQPQFNEIDDELTEQISSSNTFLINTLKDLAGGFDTNKKNEILKNKLETYRNTVKTQHSRYKENLINITQRINAISVC